MKDVVFVKKPENPQFIDLTGSKFNHLTVLGYAGLVGKKQYWFCECDCGNVSRTNTSKLRSGRAKSCGCMVRVWASERAKARARPRPIKPKKPSRNVFLTYPVFGDGISIVEKTLTVTQWAHELDLPVSLIFARLYRGWSTEEALLPSDFSERPGSQRKRRDYAPESLAEMIEALGL